MVVKHWAAVPLLISLLFVSLFMPAQVQADFSLAGSNSFTGTASVAMPITDLQITGTGTEPIPVKLRVTSGSLSMSTTTGLTFDGSSTGSTIYFSGTQANVNAALATLTYTRVSTGTDTLEVSLVSRGEVFFTENNHLYKFITGSITANNARTAAAAQTAYGATGYLATITSQAENDFVAARLQGDGWMGASDASQEGDWKWITGPESGTSFWSGASGGSTVGGAYANWASGEPNDYLNGSPGEDCAQFYITTGKWNDLPCSGSNLSGYVVEFGTTGDMPTVTAKNISITTSSNPTVNTLTPADGATNVVVNANLVMVFSTTMTRNTGNILIKKSADDTTVETIDVSGSQVTGSGTNTITINPATDLAESTGYYITVPNTAFKDGSNNFYAGISNSTTWNFTTGDFTAPAITNVAAGSVSETGATLSWTTNEQASTKVSYGLTSSYGTDTSETDTSPRVTSHSRSISSLLACTTYHYAVVSRDSSANSATSTDRTFTTTGCTSSASPSAALSEAVTVASGGTTSLTDGDKELTVQTPANFTSGVSSVVIQIKSLPNTAILAALGKPASVPHEVGDIVFDVKAIINGTTELDSFDAPVTITYEYTDADINGLDEASLWLHHYHNGAWSPLNSCTVSQLTNTITCTTPSFSIFGLFGRPPATSTGSSVAGSPSPVCTAQPPGSKPPALYAAVPQSATSIMLYFAAADDPVDHYLLEYGTESQQYQHGNANIGDHNARTFLVDSLLPNTTYYFKITSANGCAYGPASNELSAKTKSLAAIQQLQFTDSQLEAVAEPTERAEVLVSDPEPQSCQPYTTQVGDSLWQIAQAELGDGRRYKEIVEQNQATYPSLQSSNTIRAGWKLQLECISEAAVVPEAGQGGVGYKLTINVLDTDKSPVKGAKVILHSTPREAVTDDQGVARFENVEPGQHQVQIAYAKYTGEQNIVLDGDVKEFALHITVEQKSVQVSRWLVAIIGVLVVIIGFLLFLLKKRGEKKK